MSFYRNRIFKCLFRFLFCKNPLIVTGIFFFLLLLVGTYTFSAVRYEHLYGRYNTSRTHDLKRIFTAFQRFREIEGRWPACLDEAGTTPYNGDLKLGELRENFSKLPYRCVTLRSYHYQYADEDKDKVLVTLYEPYRTQLWPFGKMNTDVLLADGSIYSISPDGIEIKEAIQTPALSQKYEIDGEYEKALSAYEDIYKNSDYYKNSTVRRQRQPNDLTYARIYYKQHKKRESFQEYCKYAQWCLRNRDNRVYGEREDVRSAITMMYQNYRHTQSPLAPFQEYQNFIDFMEEEYAHLGSSPEYEESMQFFRNVKK
jgi:hypothetical protein